VEARAADALPGCCQRNRSDRVSGFVERGDTMQTPDETRMSENRTLAQAVAKALSDAVSSVPDTDEPVAADPARRAASLVFSAKARAAAISATLSLPPGPVGFLTILPDLVAIWRIQKQLVADVAGAYGVDIQLTPEAMLYCLFRHAASQVVRDLAVRVGERILIRRATLKTMQTVLEKVGVKVTQRVIGRAASRWIPIVGAVGVGAYAWYDTAQVGRTAVEVAAALARGAESA